MYKIQSRKHKLQRQSNGTHITVVEKSANEESEGTIDSERGNLRVMWHLVCAGWCIICITNKMNGIARARRARCLNGHMWPFLMCSCQQGNQSNGTHMNVMPKLLCAFGVYRRRRQRIEKIAKQSKCKVSKSVGKKCKRYDNSKKKMCFFFSVSRPTYLHTI